MTHHLFIFDRLDDELDPVRAGSELAGRWIFGARVDGRLQP
jgi:hypothetical protein